MTSVIKFRTKGLPGQYSPGPFSRDSIRDIVKNPFHVGLVARYPRPPLDMEDDPEYPLRVKPPKRVGNKRDPIELIPGQHKALYSVQLWQKNQEKYLGIYYYRLIALFLFSSLCFASLVY